jgi:hypothetical protein
MKALFAIGAVMVMKSTGDAVCTAGENRLGGGSCGVSIRFRLLKVCALTCGCRKLTVKRENNLQLGA